MKDTNYIQIAGWMVKKLGLKGNELLAYALIYGFSQDGSSCFAGSAKYIADWLNIDRRNALAVLGRLVDKGLIIKNDKIVNGVKLCDYQVVLNNVECESTELNEGGDETSQGMMLDEKMSSDGGDETSQVVMKHHRGGDETSLGGGDETSHHNTKRENIEEKTRYSLNKRIKNDFDEFWLAYKPVMVNGRGTGRGSKALAKKKYDKVIASGVEHSVLMESSKRYLDDCRKHNTFSKMVSTWLNNNGWEDDYVESPDFTKFPKGDVLALWNRIAERWDLPVLKFLTDERSEKLMSNMEKFGYGERYWDFFNTVDEAVMCSLWLRGLKQEKDGDEWVCVKAYAGCSFDWLMVPENLCRVLEGYYEDEMAKKEKSRGRFENYKRWMNRERGEF